MPAVLSILFGAAFALGASYALGNLLLPGLPLPRPIRLATGAALLSLVVFLTLIAGIAGPLAFAIIGALSLIGLGLHAKSPSPVPRPPTPVLVVLAAYGLLYLVHSMAPEIEPDGIMYHLGLVAEYLRLGRFPRRVGFYEMLPQGAEMLYVFAFAFGKHSAAKLVHFGLLAATVPLMRDIGRRLGLSDTVSLAAAGLYLCTPVVGVSGTSSYNDAALAFYGLAAFYLVLAWRQERDDRYLLPAGIAAGFCYAIKLPWIIVLVFAAAAVLVLGRRVKPLVFLLAAGLAMIAPWMLRDYWMTGNPFAPLFNAWFPNPYFHVFGEQFLRSGFATFAGTPLWRVPWELAVGGRLQGILGPLFLVILPVSLLALRRPAGRILWLAAAILALPWFWNHGARFLVPALPLVALGFAMAVPRPVLGAALAFQAIACWPAALDLYTSSWRLTGFPWRAALRIEPEPAYLSRMCPLDYNLARRIESVTFPGEKVFSLMAMARAYTEREPLVYWESAEGERLLDTLRVAGPYKSYPFYDLKAEWPAQPLKGVRFRLLKPHPGEWYIHEVRLYLGSNRVRGSPQWSIDAYPNPAELPAAFDGNLATRWRTWEPMAPGMFVEVLFDQPQALTAATLLSHSPIYKVPVEFQGLGADGYWKTLATVSEGVVRAPEDLRPSASYALRRAGFSYLLVSTAGDEGNSPLGKLLAADPEAWNLNVMAHVADVYLFRIR